MKCPHCGADIQDGEVCRVCGAVRSEDFFISSPEVRRDTKHTSTRLGFRRFTSRSHLPSFMAMLVTAIVLIFLLGVFTIIILVLWR